MYQSGMLPRSRLPVPVISVGNLTLGGTGKTPLILFLARRLQGWGRRPAILTRGYMPSGRDPGASDEAALLTEELPGVPIGVGADRVATARRLLAEGTVDVFLLDDGFQYLRLHRDLDLVLINAVRPFGNGCLLPRGILREGCEALSRCDGVLVTRVDMGRRAVPGIREFVARHNPHSFLVEARHRMTRVTDLVSGADEPVSVLAGRRVLAVCGLAEPGSFAAGIEALAEVVERMDFPDHHPYRREEIETIRRRAREKGIGIVVTTSKDAVKWRPWAEIFTGEVRCLVVRIDIELVCGAETLDERIRRLL